MKKLGCLGATLAMLLFAVGSQATVLGVSYTAYGNYTGTHTAKTQVLLPIDFGSLWFVSDSEPTSEQVSWRVPSDRTGWYGFFQHETQTLSSVQVDFQFRVQGAWDDLLSFSISGSGPSSDLSTSAWTWDNSITFDIDDSHTLDISLGWADCPVLSGSCLYAFLNDPVSGDGGSADNGAATAVPAPSALPLFALALTLLGAAVCVRRRHGTSNL